VQEVPDVKALILLFPLFCFAAAQAQESPLPRYEVKRAKSRINVDGKLTDKAWEDAPVVELMFPFKQQTGRKQTTRVRLLWDEEALYAGYDCEDEDITAQYVNRDDPTYQDDVVEFFLNPKPSQDTIYFGMEMNARAVMYDYLMASGTGLFKQFDLRNFKLATSLRGTMNARGDKDEGWSLEVAIPWDNFDGLGKRPKDGTEWRAQINRWDNVNPERVLSMWSDPLNRSASPHVPKRFGILVFAE
jgi:hypothetical protein